MLMNVIKRTCVHKAAHVATARGAINVQAGNPEVLASIRTAYTHAVVSVIMILSMEHRSRFYSLFYDIIN